MEQKLDRYNLFCGCKPYYLPGETNKISTYVSWKYILRFGKYIGKLPWCNASGIECINNIGGILNRMEENIYHIFSLNFLISVSLDYEDNCLPLCEEIYYDSTISSAKFPASSGEAYYYLSKNLAKKLQEIYVGYLFKFLVTSA